ncbi:unnamed protein product [Dracunculus medinensis]|uniref:Transcription initiation factor TFIID subunit 2 n=1 Tax=Dracunculus medinensis TaxID=318479 RepID=A0A0N4U809_DRAME|nr:unnamed protein product [Dracunculus medinensis]
MSTSDGGASISANSEPTTNNNNNNSGSLAVNGLEQKEKHSIDCNFRVLSQKVLIKNIDFRNQSFDVFTELSLVPMKRYLRQIVVDIGTDMVLPSELSSCPMYVDNIERRITVDGVESNYTRRDIFKTLPQAYERESFNGLNLISAVRCNLKQELVIDVPESCFQSLDEAMVIKVGIAVKVVKAKKGIQFIGFFNSDEILEKGAHLYTYRSDVLSSTHEWLPCLDAPFQLCLWRIEIVVDNVFMAIASGELIDKVYTPDKLQTIFCHQLLIPTSAMNIGFAVGHFTPYVQPDLAEVASFALPSLLPLVKHTVAPVDRAFEFFEELLSCRFPYSSYKQVFVDQVAAEQIISYTSLTIASVNILYHKKILDMVQETRILLAGALAQQFFGCFVTVTDWLDLWIVKSLSRFIAGLYIERYFGTCEYLYLMQKILNSICDYENQWGKIYLRKKQQNDSKASAEAEPIYAEILYKKGHFVLRMLNKRLGNEPFFQVVHKILGVAIQFSKQQQEPLNWHCMAISTESFFRTVSNVTGFELPTFLEQWIYGGGHANLNIQYAFNRKRNMIELEVVQDAEAKIGRQSYVGPVTLIVQELDGYFTHTLQIDTDHSKHDLQCHSKGRRQKKKKIPLSNNEELEIDLVNTDPDSPVLWIRVDPNLLLVRRVKIRQPVYQWEYMLKYERDVLAQFQALNALRRFPSPHVRTILLEAIECELFYYRVRCRAAFCLSEVVSKLPETWLGSPVLLTLHKKFFCCKSAPNIPKPNNFVVTSSNLQSYFLMQAIPQALARVRSASNTPIAEILQFILGLIKYNDNSINRYSDDYYRASLICALSGTIIQNDRLDGNLTPDSLCSEMRDVLSEFTHALNMDTLKPTFGRIVGISALQAIYKMQILSQIPLDPQVFWLFARFGIYSPMRRVALTILVDMVHRSKATFVFEMLDKLIDMSINDPDPAVRYHIAAQFCCRHPLVGLSGNETSYPLNESAKIPKEN